MVDGAGVENGKDEREPKLNDGKQSGERQVGKFEHTQINFNFECGEVRSTQQKNDAETGEIKHKDEQGGGKQRRAQQWKGNVFPHVERIRAEGTGGGFEFRVEAGEGVADDADDDGGVVKNVGKKDERKG